MDATIQYFNYFMSIHDQWVSNFAAMDKIISFDQTQILTVNSLKSKRGKESEHRKNSLQANGTHGVKFEGTYQRSGHDS